jgi:hypothetical protein
MPGCGTGAETVVKSGMLVEENQHKSSTAAAFTVCIVVRLYFMDSSLTVSQVAGGRVKEEAPEIRGTRPLANKSAGIQLSNCPNTARPVA